MVQSTSEMKGIFQSSVKRDLAEGTSSLAKGNSCFQHQLRKRCVMQRNYCRQLSKMYH